MAIIEHLRSFQLCEIIDEYIVGLLIAEWNTY